MSSNNSKKEVLLGSSSSEKRRVKNKKLNNLEKEELIRMLEMKNFQYGELSNKYASLKYKLEVLGKQTQKSQEAKGK